MSNNISAEVQSLKDLLRWVTVLENYSDAVIRDLDRFASNRDMTVKDLHDGKTVLKHIIKSLESKNKEG